MCNDFRNTKAALKLWDKARCQVEAMLQDVEEDPEDVKEWEDFALGRVQEAYLQDQGSAGCACCVFKMTLKEIEEAIK